ncbi:hypothetical protein COCNU_03G001260 [Cocos nucifera]|uniref:Uncharacterized protein n=1 Tax=Cocos nucifera TaxID=13894 RepID=A0A8K0I1A2_COCNU|nr:hypothetical protein COCNU_03G001260 [Cocos nucifera]
MPRGSESFQLSQERGAGVCRHRKPGLCSQQWMLRRGGNGRDTVGRMIGLPVLDNGGITQTASVQTPRDSFSKKTRSYCWKPSSCVSLFGGLEAAAERLFTGF